LLEKCVDGWTKKTKSQTDRLSRTKKITSAPPSNSCALDQSFVGKRIEYLASFGEDCDDDDDDDGDDSNNDNDNSKSTSNKSDLHWCIGTIEKIIDGGKRALVLWEAIPKFDYPEQRTVEVFSANKFKSRRVGGWILHNEIDYGL
jgi:hypothetical protein